MRKCKKIQNLFVDACYGELSGTAQSRFEQHIDSCPSCAGQYAAMKRTLNRLSEYKRPELAENYWDGYWNTLEQKIETEQARRVPLGRKLRELISGLVPPVPVSYRPLLSGAALLMIGIFIGRTFLTDPGAMDQSMDTMPSLQQAHAQRVHARTAEYFGRARLVLLGIVNCDTEEEGPLRASFGSTARVSQALLRQSVELRAELGAINDNGLLELIKELETVLLQTANLGEDYEIVDIRLIQHGAERKALLFKITIGESMLAKYAAINQAILDPDNKSTGENEGKIL